MRFRIFTEREREIIKAIIEDSSDVSRLDIAKFKYRVKKGLKKLESDLELLNKMREILNQPSPPL